MNNVFVTRTGLDRLTKEGESPVWRNEHTCVLHLSRTGHVESCLNLGGPSSKAKYYLVTDSESVP